MFWERCRRRSLAIKKKMCDDKFASETRSLMFLHGNGVLTEGLKEDFRVFHDFSVRCGVRVRVILYSYNIILHYILGLYY
jgi:hypothetical protein